MTTTTAQSPYLDTIPEGPGFPTVADAVAICRFAVSGFYRDTFGIKASSLDTSELELIRADPARSVRIARAIMDEAGTVWTWERRRRELFRRLENRP